MICAPKAGNGRVARWLVTAVTAAVCFIVSPQGVRFASAQDYVDVEVAPPPVRVEVIPVRPSPRHLWVHGYWNWDGNRHSWVPGHYVLVRPGLVYVEPRWEDRGGGHWRYHRGGWTH